MCRCASIVEREKIAIVFDVTRQNKRSLPNESVRTEHTTRRAGFHYLYVLKHFLLYAMGLLYMVAGINHFFHPETYLAIMPPWLPAHSFLVFFSGVAELLLGILLLVPTTRPFAAWGIILLLVAVFPANIQMAINFHREASPFLWLALLRLPVQFLLIWWAWQYTKKTPTQPS